MNRKLLTVAVAGALALPMTAQVQAANVKPHPHPATYEHEHELEGKDGVMMMAPLHAHEHDAHPHEELHSHSYTLSGHVGRTINHVDGPGEAASGPKWAHGGLGASGSRFRITGSEELENGVTVGVNLEYAIGDGGAGPSVRHSSLTFDGAFGSIAAGQTSPSTNGTNDDLSTSSLAVDMACSNATKGMKVGDAAEQESTVCTDFTAGRRGVIRYSTPAIGAIGISGSFARDFWDGQLSTGGELGGGSYALRASFAVDGDGGDGASGNGVGKKTYSVAAAVKAGGASMSTLWGSINRTSAPWTQTGCHIFDSDGFGVKLAYDFGRQRHRRVVPGN